MNDSPSDLPSDLPTDSPSRSETAATASPTRAGHTSMPKWAGALAGLLAAAVAVGVSALLAAVMKVVSSTNAVGSAFIDRTPPWLEEWAIAQFGTNDKAALRVGIFVVMALLAVIFGIIAIKRPMVGVIGIIAFGVVGAIAVATRATGGSGAAIAPLIGAVVGSGVLWLLVRPRQPETPTVSQVPLGWDRRRFLSTAGGAAIGAGVVAVAGRAIQARNEAAYQKASAEATKGVTNTGVEFVVPGGAELDPTTPFVTPIDKFYRIDAALSFPRANLDTWKLSIEGMVDKPVSFSYADLLAMPQVERPITICCVSNEVGGGLIGNAVWRGVLLKDLLDQAGVHDDAEQVYSTSLDGWTCGFPVSAALDGRDAMVALSMNGEPLPLEHGHPARLIVPGLYGYVSATKWLSKIELTSWEKEGYWIPRGWSQQAPIKTQSRIGFPRVDANVAAGATKIAGVAWAQHRGISKVEVQVDDGPWQEAKLGTDVSEDTWRQWTLDWSPTPGKYTVRVRATDGNGDTQPEEPAPARPDGATGYHTVQYTVR